MSSKSAAHIAEILGIAPTPSRSDLGEQLSERPQGKLTCLTDEVEMEKITTSTKSLADYFKEKLGARSSSAIVSTFAAPRDSDNTPRMGLGSQARLEISRATGEVEQKTDGMDLSTFSAFSSSLVYEKTEDSATMPKETKDMEKKKKMGRKVKNEKMEKEDSAGEHNDDTKEREERKRKRKLDKEKKDSHDNLKELKKQEKRKRKAEKLQLVKEDKPHKGKGFKSGRNEHTKAHVS